MGLRRTDPNNNHTILELIDRHQVVSKIWWYVMAVECAETCFNVMEEWDNGRQSRVPLKLFAEENDGATGWRYVLDAYKLIERYAKVGPKSIETLKVVPNAVKIQSRLALTEAYLSEYDAEIKPREDPASKKKKERKGKGKGKAVDGTA